MNRYAALVAELLLFATVAGCITEINARKVPVDQATNGKENGYYYSLPIPYLVVKPKGDGTMDVEVEYLPDPDHQYAVSAWSFLGSHELTVEVDDNGLLKKIVWDKDDSAVAAQLANSAGNVGAAKITADGEAKKAEEAKKETQAKERAAKLDEARKAQAEAQVNYDVAVAELKSLEALRDAGQNVSTELRAAIVRVAAAEARLNAASGLIDPASQPVEPHKLRFIKRRTHEPAVRCVYADDAQAAAFGSEHPRLRQRLIVTDFRRSCPL